MSAQPPQAIERHSRFPGWIWAVPAAALLIVGYLAYQQISRAGPEVHVSFPTGGDINASSTKVKFQGIVVGEVESVSFAKDLRHIDTVLSLHSDMAGHLGKGTRFWVSGRTPSITDLESLKSVIAGPFIGIEPHPGSAQDHYEGLGERPVTAFDRHVTHYLLTAPSLGTISRGTSVYYRNLVVGEVEDAKLSADQRHFDIDVSVNAPFDRLVHQGTRFWDASAVQVSMSTAGPKLQLESLPSLFEGAISFETPDAALAGPVAGADSTFPVYPSQAAAEHAPGPAAVRYQVVFPADQAGGLQAGAPVTLAEKTIGSVTGSTLQYDPVTHRLRDVVLLAVDADNIALANGAAWAANPRTQLDAMLRDLISQGLRARLGSTVPVVGGKSVELAFIPKATPASLSAGNPPDIPVGPQSDINGILSAVNVVAAKIEALPLDQIGESVQQAARHVAAISGSPEVADSLKHLDQSLTNVEQMTVAAKSQLGPVIAELHRTAREAQEAVADVRTLVSNDQLAASQPGTAGVGEALYEVSRAARSLRELSDYLDRHPEALLRGKD